MNQVTDVPGGMSMPSKGRKHGLRPGSTLRRMHPSQGMPLCVDLDKTICGRILSDNFPSAEKLLSNPHESF